MMIQNTTFLRRAVGSLLVALVTLVGFQAQAQLDFSTSTEITWNEDPAEESNNLTAINGRIAEGLAGSPAATICYVVTGISALELSTGTANCRPDGRTTFTVAKPATGISGGPPVLAVADGKHVDYDVLTGGSPSQTLTVSAHNTAGKGKVVGTLTIAVKVTNYDEQPMSTQNAKTNKEPVWYLSKGDSRTVLISGNFRDPEGAPVYFDSGATSTDVWVCDSATAGDSAIDAEFPPTARTDAPGADVTVGGTDSADCTVSNTGGTTPAPGIKGTAGNRVVTTRKVGPILHITADSLVTDTSGSLEDPNTDLVDRPKGTYTGVVYYRVWSGPATGRLASSDWSMATVHVKIGANNLPQFAGGATGYNAEMNEGTSSVVMTAWVAGDLDEGGVNNDMLSYKLVGDAGKGVACAGGTLSATFAAGNSTASPPTEDRITLSGKDLDYETATMCTVNLQVTDNWSDPVSVPITVTLKNANELNFAKKADGKTDNKIADQKMVNGLKRTFNLDDYFDDPEGDPITYTAHTNIYTNVVSLGEGNVLTVTGANATAGADSTVTVTITASDGKGGSLSDTFTVTTRASNDAPEITLVKSGTIAIGASVNENGAKGEQVGNKVACTDDDPYPDAILTGSSHFKASSADDKCEITISVDTPLNYEAADRHVLKLVLRDKWDDTIMSEPLEIQVSVVDQNDAPTLAAAYQELEEDEKVIDDQMIVVSGSGSLYTGMYFTDEDGDRLLVDASSSDMTKVAVSTSGLDDVKFSGVAVTEEDAPVTVTLTASDPEGASVNLTFDVHVGENNGPVADADAFAMRLPADNTINIGAFADIELDGLFSDPDGGDMVTSITAMSSDNDVLLVIVNDGTATLVGRSSGEATLTITAMDMGGNATPVMETIIVNAAPEESMPLDPQTLDRVTPHVVDVSGVFTDSDDGDGCLVIPADTLGDGQDRVMLDVMGFELTITGVAGIEPGDVEIVLTATDPHGATVKSTFMATTINIAPTVAMSVEAQELDRIDPLSVDVGEVFADIDGEISAITASVPEDAVIEVGEIDLEDNMLMITALAVGEATVTLEATDNNGGMITDTFTVTVNNVDPVVANAIMDQTLTRIDDLELDISMTFNDPDTDSPLTFTVMAADDMIADPMVDGTMLTVQGLYVGSTTITITATDVDGGMFSHDFMVEVENVKPTVAMSIDDMSFDRIAPLGIDLSGTFADADGMISTLTAMVSDDSLVSAMIEDSTLTLTALAVGSATITLTAVDDNGGEIMTDFDVTVVNIVPVVANAVADQTTTRVDDLSIDISDTFNDPDQDNSMLSITVMVEDDMTVDASLDGHMLMISGLEVGSTNVTLTAVDADGGMVSNTFMTTIENIAPVVANSIADQEMDRRAPLVLDLSNVFSDADNGTPTITVMIGSGMVLSADDISDMMLSLNALAVGETTVTLTATDVNGASVMDEFNVTVINIEPVVANAIADQTTTRVDDLSIDVGMTFDDPDQDNSMLTLAVTVADGTYVDASLSGSSLMINGLDVGSTMVTLTATDADGGMVQTTFTTTVENIAPVVANSISPISLEVGGQPASQAVAGLFSDDGDPLTYSITSGNSGIASTTLSGTTAMVGPVSRGSTNFTVTATDPHGGSASVTGSVTVGDGELKAVAAKSLAGFGRALLASVSSSVGSRVMTDARSSDLTLDAWAPVENQGAMALNMSADERSDAAWNTVNAANTASTTSATTDAFGGQMTGLDALQSTFGQNFALNLGSSENPSNWSVWGDIDRQSYEGEGYDGMASSVYLGADVTVAECWIFGVAVSSSSGESDYSWGTATQTMDLSLTTVLPYVSYQPTNGSSIWGVAGFGSGELDTTVVGASNDVSDLTSTITMVGGSQELTKVGRMSLALRGDAATASLETEDGNGAADGLAADVNRIRVGLEGSFRTETGQGGMLEPFGQVSLRSDGGDGDTGTGIEVAGGVRMTSSTFTLEIQGRTLAMHGADEYSESGFSLMAKLNPSASMTGVAVTIAPRWGADALGNGMLWQDDLKVGSANTYGALTGFGNAGANKSIDAQIGYGMLVANEQYLLTPFVDFGVTDGDRREMLLGASLRQLAQGNAILDINLALGRVEERTGASSGKIGLNANLRF
ncbi:MAG: hypothetical protein OXG05_00405 [Gammaproteobacteria bacterium]|nr:hypothetical protein [Gammaproteobacteria bacterium]